MTLTAIPGLPWTWPRFGGLLGFAGVLVFTVGIVLRGDVPQISDSPQATLAWYQDNGQRYLIADFIIALGVTFGLLPFFVTVRNVLGIAEGSQSFWPQLGFLGGIFFLLLGGAFACFHGALAVGANNIDDPNIVAALQYADFYGFGGLSLGVALFMIATAMGILRTSIFPHWIAFPCVIFFVLGIAGAASPIEGDPKGPLSIISVIDFAGLGLVIMAMGLALFLRKT